MGDTTTLWVVELFELWKNQGDDSLLNQLWPTARRAVYWAIENAEEIGLPYHLECTYDIIAMSGYNTTTFNSFLYLTMLRAAVVMANYVVDISVATASQNGTILHSSLLLLSELSATTISALCYYYQSSLLLLSERSATTIRALCYYYQSSLLLLSELSATTIRALCYYY